MKGDEHFAVTGATGWLGRCTLDVFDEVLGPDQAGHRVTAFASRTHHLTTALGRQVQVHPLDRLLSVSSPSPTHVLHFAYLTKDRLGDIPLDNYVARNTAITATVLRALERHQPRALVAASSGAVYRSDGGLATDLTDNPYGTLKHLDELVFASACASAGIALVVPRIFSLAGRHMSKPERYALGTLILDALAGTDLQVSSPRPVVRSYADVQSVVGVALWLALQGRSDTFDTGGVEMEVGELAQHVIEALDLSEAAVIRPAESGQSDADRYVGNPSRWLRLTEESGIEPRLLDVLIREAASDLTASRSANIREHQLSTTERTS